MARMLASESSSIVAILGATGAGKSSFVQTLTGQAVPLSHGLESSTTSITSYTILHPDDTGRTMTVLDTPGLDGEDMSDVEIMQNILTFIKERHGDDASLSGIVYLHRITDARVGGQASRALNTFRTLTGSASFGQVVLMTTMWDLVDPAIGEKREAALRNTYWRPLISRGATIKRFLNNQGSAIEIVGPIGRRDLEPGPGPSSSSPLGRSRGSGAQATELSSDQRRADSLSAEDGAEESHQPPPPRPRRSSKIPYRHIRILLCPVTTVATAAVGWTADLMDWIIVEPPLFPVAVERLSSTARRIASTTKILLLIKWPGVPPVPFP